MGQSQPAVDHLATYDPLQPGDQEVALALTELGSRKPSAEPNNDPSASTPPKSRRPSSLA